jgi:mRNA interferase RelE/StbE
MMWELFITKSAAKDLESLVPRDRERIKTALWGTRENPFRGDIVRLKGAGDIAWRRRVGDWRILYDLHSAERRVVVTAIARRTSTTY